MPWEYVRAVVCERFGWTFDYFDGLDTQVVHEILAIWDGVQKAQDPVAATFGRR